MSLSREEIIRMARDAGAMPIKGEPKQLAIVTNLMIERFANAAYAAGAAAEREACAKVCDDEAAMEIRMIGLPVAPSEIIQKDRAKQFNKAAAAIRARGDK